MRTYKYILIALLFIMGCKSNLDKGIELTDKFKYEEAKVYLKKAVLNDPNNPEKNFLLAKCFLYLKNEDSADVFFNKAISIDKTYSQKVWSTYYYLLFTMYDHNDFKTGDSYFKKAYTNDKRGIDKYLYDLHDLTSIMIAINLDEFPNAVKPTPELISKMFDRVKKYTDKYDTEIIGNYYEGAESSFRKDKPKDMEFYIKKCVELDSSMVKYCAKLLMDYSFKIRQEGKPYEEYNYYIEKANELTQPHKSSSDSLIHQNKTE